MSNEKNIFELATREKFRFSFKGVVSTEDLWDLTAKDLDSIYKNLNSQLKQVKEESLLEAKTQQDEELDMKIEIVKYIFKVKSAEAEAKIQAKANREKREKIKEILAAKQDADLQNKTPEELQAMLNELG